MFSLSLVAKTISIIILISLLTACAHSKKQRGQGDGFYIVKKGDTLISISRAVGQNYHDIAKWNHLSDKDKITVGQVLRLKPTTSIARSATKTKAPALAKAQARIMAPMQRLQWMWPTQGQLTKNTAANMKGITLAGTAGQPILAAASGKVIYKGRGIGSYGNMVIIRHDYDYLSVYAHNRNVLVEEGQTVSLGRKIATMGETGNGKAQLYFEIRLKSNPVDALKLLPSR